MHGRTHPHIVTTAVMLAVAACESPIAEVAPVESDLSVAAAHRGPPEVARPFRADFSTDLASFAPGPECTEEQLVNTQVGDGVSTLLGRFSTHLTFCVNLADLGVLADNELSEGESLPYSDGRGVLTAANGDELYLEISGVILPSVDPEYDFQFMDPFTFVGGTGRFEGASGGGETESFVDFAGGRTDHLWTGELVTRPGR